MGLSRRLIQCSGRLVCWVLFCTNDIRVRLVVLGLLVLSIVWFRRQGCRSCQEHRSRSRDTDAQAEGHRSVVLQFHGLRVVVCAPTILASSHGSLSE